MNSRQCLVLIRHAATPWNRDGRLQGRIDVGLDGRARRDLRGYRLPPAWRRWQCLCSPLRRTRQTARALGLRARPARALREMDWGRWEGLRLADLRRSLGRAMAENESRGLDFRPPGGESPRRVMARLRPWLARLARAGGPRLLVTHKGVMRAMLALASGWDMRGPPPGPVRWSAAQVYRLSRSGRPTLVLGNWPLRRPCPIAGAEPAARYRLRERIARHRADRPRRPPR